MYIAIMKDGIKEYLEDNEFAGFEISEHAIENKRLDYYSMVYGICRGILAEGNHIANSVDDWEFVNGDKTADIYGYYIISDFAVAWFQRLTDEPVLYSPKLDSYLLGVTTHEEDWHNALTEWEIVEQTEDF